MKNLSQDDDDRKDDERAGGKKKRKKATEPQLRLDTLDGFLATIDALDGVRTVYITPHTTVADVLAPAGSLTIHLSAKDEQNLVTHCYLALSLTRLDLDANREATLQTIEKHCQELTEALEEHGLEVKRGQWVQ